MGDDGVRNLNEELRRSPMRAVESLLAEIDLRHPQLRPMFLTRLEQLVADTREAIRATDHLPDEAQVRQSPDQLIDE